MSNFLSKCLWKNTSFYRTPNFTVVSNTLFNREKSLQFHPYSNLTGFGLMSRVYFKIYFSTLTSGIDSCFHNVLPCISNIDLVQFVSFSDLSLQHRKQNVQTTFQRCGWLDSFEAAAMWLLVWLAQLIADDRQFISDRFNHISVLFMDWVHSNTLFCNSRDVTWSIHDLLKLCQFVLKVSSSCKLQIVKLFHVYWNVGLEVGSKSIHNRNDFNPQGTLNSSV